MKYRGLTWDHPRGYRALLAAGGPINWDIQPLEGFESAPIGDICARYDLVVLDHPHLGEALAQKCLRPLDEVLPASVLEQIARGAIGSAYSSYQMAGRQWALPLDAAAQVMALRGDLVDDPPESWDEVEVVSRQGGVAVSRAGPHALVSLLSICAALDSALDMRDAGWPDDEILAEAADRLGALDARSPHTVRKANPIEILEHMTRSDDVRLVPLIYGYVNYAVGGPGKAVTFRDAPHAGARPGSILGGTGIALSARAEPDAKLCDHLIWLMSETTQRTFIPDNDGQPGLRSAWADPLVDARWGGFYSGTARTLEAAAIRPRHDGYIAFQTEAADYLRHAFDRREAGAEIARRLRSMFEQSLDRSATDMR